MQQARGTMAQNLAERMCWVVARRDATSVGRCLQRRQVAEGAGVPARQQGIVR
jgi:hypothetical protein